MRRWALVVLTLLLCLLVSSVAAFQIVEFCPDTYTKNEPDEYLVLAGAGPLADLVISDSVGSLRFPSGAVLDSSAVIARNGTAYRQTFGVSPDFEMYDSSPAIRDMVRKGDLRLGNEHDQVVLTDHGTVVQTITWPGDVDPKQGQVHIYADGAWDRRMLLIGQSRLPPATFQNVTLTAFVSPDSSAGVFYDAVNGARRSIDLNVYELTDPAIGAALIAAAGRGVSVRVLLEGGPVGGISPAEKGVVRSLQEHQIPVMLLGGVSGVHARYRYDHAKYLVIDDSAVLVTSENFKPGGFPEEGTSGNRGWGALVHDPRVAAYFAGVFSLDWTGVDIAPAPTGQGGAGEEASGTFQVRSPATTFSDTTVTPVLAPDTSSLITDLIAGATRSVRIEQAYIKNTSAGTLNPFLEAAIADARRGVSVQVILDSAWFNVDDLKDNDEMVAYINQVAVAEHLPLEARLADLTAQDLVKIHNKGVIVDDRRVLVSSINWNTVSPNENREAGLIIDSSEVGAYYAAVFATDWDARSGSSEGKAGRTGFDPLKGGIAAVVLVVIALAVRRRRA
ncbi:phospholipase D-like domain-containing protein [Methanosphaerula subterraneus]|uniref:phospholipase D-like domain-containing protein n=1 Tax=Methanosphaerula subterraneus TaxID=3350244 RepID=UPI003F83190F